MSSEESKALVRRLVEVSNQGNLDALDDLIAHNFVDHSPYAQAGTAGIEGHKQFARMLRSGFPDSQWTIDDLVAEGDKLVMRWTSRGTHQGEAFGIPATGRSVVVTGITIYRVSGGKLAEQWTEVDMLGLMQQLGVAPPPRQGGR
ncbi:MAG TPA: ester cyclase [Roseiflexaceae bacterium]|nr:ester cyclase [Roseiflexaceae bacterium]